jgi:hypothetical protein
VILLHEAHLNLFDFGAARNHKYSFLPNKYTMSAAGNAERALDVYHDLQQTKFHSHHYLASQYSV